MKKVEFHYGYPLSIDIDTEKKVDVYIDRINMHPVLPGAIRIVILEEPRKSQLFEIVQKQRNLYTYLLTFHDEILSTNSKAGLFHCTNTWVKGYTSPQKQFSVSTVVGGKSDSQMKGYAIRHNLWKCKELITIPKEFYLSGKYKWDEVDYTNNLILGNTKTPLFDSMFHIAIENISIKNYFSEKLIDCFQTRTVPIYCGCLNIGDFFNVDGIVIAHNVKEIVEACNQLTPEIYDNMLEAMEDNYNRSEKWCNHDNQIKVKIIELLNGVAR